jgi:hypothetical protein
MNNSTLNRKPSNDMRPNQGVSRSTARVSQQGDDESFAFNGQMGDGVNRAKNPYAHNTWSGHSNDGRDVNFGLMQSQRKGNASSSPKKVGPPATRDPHAMTIATAAGGMPVEGNMGRPKGFSNPDKINVG